MNVKQISEMAIQDILAGNVGKYGFETVYFPQIVKELSAGGRGLSKE